MSEITHSRRQFMRIGAATVGATAGIAASPAAAQTEEDPELPCYYQEWGCLGMNPIDYLTGAVDSHFSGLNDESAYENAEARSLFLQIRSDGTIMREQNKITLTQVENLIQNAKSVCYQTGRASVLEQLNNGVDPLNTLAEANEAMAEYLAPKQENLIQRWNVAVSQIEIAFNQVQETPGISVSDCWYRLRGGQWSEGGFSGVGKATVTLLDGSSVEYLGLNAENSNGGPRGVDPYNNLDSYNYDYTLWVRADDQTSGSKAKRVLPTQRFQKLHGELHSIYQECVDEIDTFVQGIKEEYQAGQITTEEITTPQDLWQMSSEDADNPYAAADLAGLGLEVNQASSVTIDLLNEEVLLDGSVYLSKSPVGENLSVGTVYDPTKSVETDSEGNPIDYAGTVDDPIPLDGLTYIAYNTDSGGSSYQQVDQPFRVVDAIGEDGETLTEVGYEASGGQQTTTTNITELREELQAMNDEIVRLEEERREIAGGGGLFSGGGVSGQTVAGILAVLVGLAALGRGG